MRKTHEDAALIAKSHETLLLLAAPQRVERIADHFFLRRRIVVAVGRRIGCDPVAERVHEQCDDHRKLFARDRARIAPHFDDRDSVHGFHFDRNSDPGSPVQFVKDLHVLVDRARERGAFGFADGTADDEIERDGARLGIYGDARKLGVPDEKRDDEADRFIWVVGQTAFDQGLSPENAWIGAMKKLPWCLTYPGFRSGPAGNGKVLSKADDKDRAR